ncbi:hypothetical protein COBT_003347, partial [Conglomerata obtusa]
YKINLQSNAIIADDKLKLFITSKITHYGGTNLHEAITNITCDKNKIIIKIDDINKCYDIHAAL